MKNDNYSRSIRCVANTYLPTKWGGFRALGFEQLAECKLETAVVLIMGDVTSGTPLVRIHSECLTGDVFGSQSMRLWGTTELGHAGYRQRRLCDCDL
jgi:GTP cyclohydrolase II